MSTNISDLPTIPQNHQPLAQNSQPPPLVQYLPPTAPTELPPRDIPQLTSTHTIDPTTIPNYIPQKGPQYIADSQYHNIPTNPSQYEISDEFKVPIVLCILYYIFQLPIINNLILRIFPDIFNASGHLTSSGTLIKSILFGIFYYIFIKGLIYFS